ncbi:Aspartate/methionine/tyrosine aminotransferase [Dethiosulfatibacter aminovorans DSM 17477]|uniref:Aminotransferase n=1 Tax=Dethiosulfatibacter aminovorans DSM 17477 TaxID=1121476 RepID=A0A1M6HUF5_9FIRM|nr:aminotransferase class I/II-fold pyridoxal phosphate-dependent enzyme [Dethiosulfatibacter aminovorans]SHJ25787.1 Aspartate/methionine/tyrosine aminotransferase [Dethiosulfatibacter aminovorans DSM 17477]
MRIEDFKLEQWLNPRDASCDYNLGASCVKAFTFNEMLEFVGENPEEILKDIGEMSLHYGEFDGSDRVRKAIAGIYEKATPDKVLTVHGGSGANNMVITELTEAGDNVVAITPNYQQHYSIPKNLGIEVREHRLKPDNGFLPNIEELRKLVDKNTKIISLTNPNNPSGAYTREGLLREMVELAREVDAYILCDEIYRGLDEEYMPSIVDVYEKGISTSSMSKVYSMAGTRIGWIVTRNEKAYEQLFNRRSYDTVSCGVIDELLTSIALENNEKILERSRQIVRKNKAILDKWMETQPKLKYCADSYGSTVLMKYDYDIPTEKFCADVLDEKGVLLCHGECFEEPNTFRLGYGFDGEETLVTGLKLLGEFLESLDK